MTSETSIKTHSRAKRILFRIPLRAALLSVRLIALFNHRWHMKLLMPILRSAGMTFHGTPRYISPKVFFDDFDQVEMGDGVVVSSNVSLLTHDYSITTVLKANNVHEGADLATVRGISIGNNVFVGRGSILMPGCKIGDDVIIGAGAVARGTIPSRSIVIGNPGEVIMTIDEQYQRQLKREGFASLRRDKV